MKSDLYKIFTSDTIQGDPSHITGFYKILKFPKNPTQNLNFWLIFGSFWITPSYTFWVMLQILCQMGGLMEVHNCGKFHLCNICGYEVKKFEMFSWRWSIQEMAHFWAFLDPNSPKYGWLILKFGPQLVLMRSKTLFQELKFWPK